MNISPKTFLKHILIILLHIGKTLPNTFKQFEGYSGMDALRIFISIAKPQYFKKDFEWFPSISKKTLNGFPATLAFRGGQRKEVKTSKFPVFLPGTMLGSKLLAPNTERTLRPSLYTTCDRIYLVWFHKILFNLIVVGFSFSVA